MNKMTFKIAWENYEKKLPQPKRVRKIKQINFEEFKNKVLEEKKDFVESIVESLYCGDAYILKGAYTKEFMNNLQAVVVKQFNKDNISPILKSYSEYEEEVTTSHDPLLEEEPAYAEAMSASVKYMIAFGKRRGQRVHFHSKEFSYQDSKAPIKSPLCGSTTHLVKNSSSSIG